MPLDKDNSTPRNPPGTTSSITTPRSGSLALVGPISPQRQGLLCGGDSPAYGDPPGTVSLRVANTRNPGPPVPVEPVDPQKLEIEWKKSVKSLEYTIKVYKDSRNRHGSTRPGGGALPTAEDVAEAMEHVAESHPDPRVRDHWKKKANAFRTAGEDEREGILEEIGKGLLILLTTPFLLAGAALGAAGSILYGVGKMLKGMGRIFSGGWSKS